MRTRRGFTIIELLIVIGIIGLLLAIVLPAAEKVRHKGYLLACASNLHSIGQAVSVYASEHRGQFPRTTYVPGDPVVWGTGAASANSFGPTGPAVNDVTAAFYLLAREQKMPMLTFICPYNDVFQYEPDPAKTADHANFTDLMKNLGYSFADPYPSDAARRAGYTWDSTLGADFPLAADKNPGVDTHGSNVLSNDLLTDAEEGASLNHEQDGQNVLYADGHVTWQKSALSGLNGDNIFANRNKRLDQSPLDKGDALLLPTDDPR
ncbi:MAG: putative major pilin subunit [Phycisphaerales bacterium]|nr:putative major pilin subunit [Phycisphaerales bacterium]